MAEWVATETTTWGDDNEEVAILTVDQPESPDDDAPKENLEKKVWRIRKSDIEEYVPQNKTSLHAPNNSEAPPASFNRTPSRAITS